MTEKLIPFETALIPESLYNLATNDTPANRLEILNSLDTSSDINKRTLYTWLQALNSGSSYDIKFQTTDDQEGFEFIFNPKTISGITDILTQTRTRLTEKKSILDSIIIKEPIQSAQLTASEVYFFGNFSRPIVATATAGIYGASAIQTLASFQATKSVQNAPGFYSRVAQFVKNNPKTAIASAIVLFFTGDYIASKTFLDKTPLITRLYKKTKDVVSGLLSYVPILLIGVGIYLLTKDK